MSKNVHTEGNLGSLTLSVLDELQIQGLKVSELDFSGRKAAQHVAYDEDNVN